MLGDMLRQFRIKRKLTQKQLADIIFLDVKSISSYETNTNVPPLPVIISLCSALKVELIIKNNVISLNEIIEDVKGDVWAMEKQTPCILDGIPFDENGKPLNLTKEFNILSKLQHMKFKNLPKCYNFTIPLEDISDCIYEIVLDKWTTVDGTLVNSIIKQKVTLPVGVLKNQAEDRVLKIPIKDSQSGLIDLYYNEDDELIIVYECYHYYDDTLTVNDVCNKVDRISKNIDLIISEELNNLAVENELNIKKVKDCILNNKSWTLDLLKFISYIDKNLMFAFCDEANKINLINIEDIIRFEKLNDLKHILPVGDNFNKLKNILNQKDIINTDNLCSLIYCNNEYFINEDNLSFDKLINSLSVNCKRASTEELMIIIEDYCQSFEHSKRFSLANIISNLTDYNVFDDKSIALFKLEQEDLIVFEICEMLLKIKKHFLKT